MYEVTGSSHTLIISHTIHMTLYSSMGILGLTSTYTQIIPGPHPLRHKQMDLVGTLLVMQGQQFTTDNATVLCNLT